MTTGRSIDHIVLAVRDLRAAGARYEALGFTLTPRASHEDRMGTSNRLAQFAGRNFIELLEVDRPAKLAEHDFSAQPPFFSFGAFNRTAISRREGMSMLVFAGTDARADCARFEDDGLSTYAPFDFDRLAVLPDGRQVTVSFTLAFATSRAMPAAAFFVCQNRAEAHFWKPQFQDHANGASGIETVYLASPRPARDGAFIGKLFGGSVTPVPAGVRVACGHDQSVVVLEPAAMVERDPTFRFDPALGTVFSGLAVRTRAGEQATTAGAEACGLFIEWV